MNAEAAPSCGKASALRLNRRHEVEGERKLGDDFRGASEISLVKELLCTTRLAY